MFYLAFFFVPIFQCSPRTKIWTPEEPGRCLDVDALYLASASFNVVSDIAMLSVPIYLIWNLQMSVQRKIGISAIFATGALSVLFRLPAKIIILMCCRACIASILRLVFRVKLARTEDYSYVKFQGVLWA